MKSIDCIHLDEAFLYVMKMDLKGLAQYLVIKL